jgi:hypothetical protein
MPEVPASHVDLLKRPTLSAQEEHSLLAAPLLSR